MFREARVDYLTWVRRVQAENPRISLLSSGTLTPLERLEPDLRGILASPSPEGGDPRVRAAVGARYGVPESEVVVALGTSLGLFLACAAAAAPGEAALVETPGYEPLRRVPEALGMEVIPVPRSAMTGWALDPDAFRAAWTPRTRLVVVSDLHNPTGRRAGDDGLAELAREAESRGAELVVDEVYREFLPGPVETSRRFGPRVSVVSSLTKVHGLGTLRAGWVLARPEQAARMRDIRNVLHALDPAPLMPLVLAGLERAEELRTEARALAAARWEQVASWAAGAEAPPVVYPHGGLVAWLPLPHGWTGTQAAEMLLEEHGVAVTPGRFFGDERGFRFGFGVDPDALSRGLDAISRLLVAAP